MPAHLEKAVEELAQGLILLMRGAERVQHAFTHEAPRPSCRWCPSTEIEVLRIVE